MYIGEGNTLVASDGPPMATVAPSGGGDYIPRVTTSPCPPCETRIVEKVVEKKIMVPVPGPTVFVDRPVTVPGPVQTVYRDRDCPPQSSSQPAQTQTLLLSPSTATGSRGGGNGVTESGLLIDEQIQVPKKKFPWWLIAVAATTVYVMRDEIFG